MFTFVIILILVAIIGFSGIYSVPDDEVHLMSFLGNRPRKDGGVQNGIGSGFLTPGLHWFLGLRILHKPVAALLAIPFEAYLFRHDADLVGDVAEIELRDMNIQLRMNILVQISDNPEGDVYKSQTAFWKAHYNSTDKDYIKQAEMIMNPYIREIFQGKPYERNPKEQAEFLAENPGYSRDSLEVTGISNIKQNRLLKELGLQKPSQTEGKFLILDTTAPNVSIGREILEDLNKSGLRLINIFIQDIAIDEAMKKSRSEIGRQTAEQNAKLKSAEIQEKVIKQDNINLLSYTDGQVAAFKAKMKGEAEGKAEALRLESKGIISAILAGSADSNGNISEQELFAILAKYPAVEKVIGDKAKFFFQGGGDGVNIIGQIVSALESQRD